MSSNWLIAALMRRWIVVAAATVLGAAIGIAAVHFVDPVYRSEAVLAPVQTGAGGSGLGSLTGQFGGLAALAGIQLPQGNDANAALETLRSRELAANLIETHKLMPLLFAKQWDAARSGWKAGETPTLNEALRQFDRKIRTVRQDTRTGIVRVAIEWREPAAAALWVNTLVTLANQSLREQEIAEADKTIAALTAEIDKTPNLEVRAALYRLIETQYKQKGVAAGREQFAFRIIDRGLAPDADSAIWPRRSVLALLGGLICGSAAATWILLMAYRRGRT